MSKLQKIILGVVATMTVMSFVAVGTLGSKSGSLGGIYNQVMQYFYEGITVGKSSQFVVANDGTLTSTATSTFSGTVTLSGPTVLGSATNGVYSFAPKVTPTASTTLSVLQSGAVFNMGTAGVNLTLPAVASSSGVYYRYVVSGAFATTNITVTSAEGDNIEGTLLVAGAVVDCDANDVVTFVADGENIGDYFDLYSNGTYWYIGSSGALTASKMTCSG